MKLLVVSILCVIALYIVVMKVRLQSEICEKITVDNIVKR